MKLVYYRSDAGNFGDDLNEWFWKRVTPDLIDESDHCYLIGIGTIIQDNILNKIPSNAPKIFIGAGAGSKGNLPRRDDTWHIYGVRGPMTASYYDLPHSAVLTDPAMLIGEFADLKSSEPRNAIGFMPHMWTIEDYDWAIICRNLGLEYIDPTANSVDTIRRISALKMLVTEAMHGAIVADTMRVPWTAVSISPRFEPSKWCDWAGSLGIDLHIHALPRLTLDRRSAIERFKSPVKTLALSVGYKPRWIFPSGSKTIDVEIAARCLDQIISSDRSQLSVEERKASALERLHSALHRLTRDYRAGVFAA